MIDHTLRDHLVALLCEGQAHATLEKILEGLAPERRSTRPRPDLPSVWEVFEHLRIAQLDILQYCIDPDWQSPPWPEGYWPHPTESLAPEQWDRTVTGFYADRRTLVAHVRDPAIDLTAVILHTQQHTWLREILLIADHNAYHAGQIVWIRKLLGNWKS